MNVSLIAFSCCCHAPCYLCSIAQVTPRKSPEIMVYVASLIHNCYIITLTLMRSQHLSYYKCTIRRNIGGNTQIIESMLPVS